MILSKPFNLQQRVQSFSEIEDQILKNLLTWRGIVDIFACIIINQMITTGLSHCAWFESCATAQFHRILVAGSYSKLSQNVHIYYVRMHVCMYKCTYV